MPLDREMLDLLSDTEEVEIETAAADGTVHRTVIWAVVVGDDAFIRSYRGPNARWYREALRDPDVALIVAGNRLAVRVEGDVGSRSIALVSDELQRKYASDPSTPAMVRAEVLDTTLRLDPVPVRAPRESSGARV